MPRPLGYKMPPEQRANITAGLLNAYAAGRRRRKSWQPPEEFREMFNELRAKFGASEAKHLVIEHAYIMARRRAIKGNGA